MKIAIIGATGNVGSRLTKEAVSRGHQVSAIARNADKLPPQVGVTAKSADFTNAAALAPLLAGHDAVLVAVKYSTADGTQILAALKQAGVKRLLVVGGAGSLQVASGADLVDTPNFHEAWKPEALAAREFLRTLRKEPALDWTMISPSALLQPGERTGKFRLGTDQLLTDAQGNSKISMEDLAVALIDELEKPKHSRGRFTAGY
jgi:putative NADH-flavin reductase